MNKNLKGSLKNHILNGKKLLTTQALFEIIDRLKATYYIQPESTDDCIGFIICGVFKILKNKKNGSIKFYQYELSSDEVGSWVESPIHSLPARLPLFFRVATNPSTHYLLDWRRAAFQLILTKLHEAGYCFTGYLKAMDNMEYSVDSNMEYEFDDGIAVSKYLFFYNEWGSYPTSDGKVEFIYDDGFYVDGDKIDLKIEIKQDMLDFVWGRKILIRETDVLIGQKTLFLELRKILDKETLSLLVRANTSCFSAFTEVSNFSLFHLGLSDYLNFKRDLIPADVGNLDKFFRYCCKNKRKQVVFDGTTKQVFGLLKCQSYLSLNDLKFLRHAPAHHAVYITSLIGEKKMTDKKKSQIKNAMNVLRNPAANKFPVTVIYRVLRELKRHNTVCSLRIIERWFEYYKDLYKNIGFTKQKRRWEAEVNRLAHVLYWGDRVQIQVNKNQMWPSFSRLAAVWTEQTYQCHENNYPKEWRKTSVDWNSISEYQIIEINTAELLYREGREMQHCVADYHGLCAKGTYKVFSIEYKDERATLGISLIEASDQLETFQIDQIRGYYNDAVNPHMIKIGKKILELVNQSTNDITVWE